MKSKLTVPKTTHHVRNMSGHQLPTVVLLAFVMAITAFLSARGSEQSTNVWLSSLDLSVVEQGWGKATADRSVEGHTLSIGGKKFEHGLGTHSPGVVVLNLNGGSSRFTAWVGIDDESGKRGSAEFQVLADSRLLWSSGVLHGGDTAKRVDLDISNVKHLALLVGDGGDGFEYDHADWAEAAFAVMGTRPRTINIVPSNPTVATPSLPLIPIITSPTVFGYQPGTPFLYTATAIGEGAIMYSAQNLPRGLAIDKVTGKITGKVAVPNNGVKNVIAAASEWETIVRATNSNGSRSIRLHIRFGEQTALVPPKGWNSYDCFGDDVSEEETLANARYMKQNLLAYGWEYIIVDYRWYDPLAAKAPNNANVHNGEGLTIDKYGRLLPSPNRFPSASELNGNGTGFTKLATKIHDMGLKFGIHIMRGIPRQAVKDNLPIEGSKFHAADAANTKSLCPWCSDMYGVDASTSAGQAWYDSIVRQYASWGIDYIKVDDMSAPYSTLEIEAVHKAISKCGRSIVLSLSPGDTPIENAKHVVQNANSWRISGDFWDNWNAVNHQFDLIDKWKGYGGAGHWPDADMIPLGHVSVNGRSVGPDRRTALNRDEQMTMMSLWAMAPSPMMLGMNLPDNDAWTTSLITNEEVMRINSDRAGTQAERMQKVAGESSAVSGTEIWIRDLSDSSKVVGLFNRTGIPVPMGFNFKKIGFTGTPRILDVWQKKLIPPTGATFQTIVNPHGVVLLSISRNR